jgi:copper chaperone
MEATYLVRTMSCARCEQRVRSALSAVEGVAAVRVDLETKFVTVEGESLNDASLRQAIEEAGYEVALQPHQNP